VNTVTFKLPKVVYDWTASPPPPPPATFGAYHDLAAADPEGMEKLREALLEFWPSLTYVASQTYASNIGRERSTGGRGYGPLYFVSRYSMSTAFLSTSHYADQDSLSARMVQARFSGMFRFSCKAFVDYMSDPTTAAAGSAGPEGTGPTDDTEYTASWDRNLLLMATALYAESFLAETGVHVPDGYGIHDFWHENCVLPNLERSAVPTALWTTDRDVYGVKDARLTEVPLIEFGPLLAYGSLRQLRDMVNGGAGYAEDYVTSAPGSFFARDTAERREWRSPFAIWRDSICNPTYKYSIEDVVGDPPLQDPNAKMITDASNWLKPSYDMYVPHEALGRSATQRRVFRGCGRGLTNADCDPRQVPSFERTSLYQFVYVTSSHDPLVQPGWHRLVHVPVFAGRACASNAKQTCRSMANTFTSNENYDASASQSRAYLAAKAAVANRLGLDLAALAQPTTASESINALDYLNTRVDLEKAREIEKQYGRRLQALTYPADGLVETAVFGDSHAYAADGTWVGHRQAITNQLNADNARVKYILIQLNDLRTEDNDNAVFGWQNGVAALFSVRCSTKLKSTTAFASHRFLESCESRDAPRPYSGRGDDCYDGVLELDATDDQQLAEFYYDRLQLPDPPPSPPPPPPRPPPPDPPSTPPPPSPPVALSLAELKAISYRAQRDFCDSVRARLYRFLYITSCFSS